MPFPVSVKAVCVERSEIGMFIGNPSSACPPNPPNLCIGCCGHMCPDPWSDVAPPAKKQCVSLPSAQRPSLQLFFLTAGTCPNTGTGNSMNFSLMLC